MNGTVEKDGDWFVAIRNTSSFRIANITGGDLGIGSGMTISRHTTEAEARMYIQLEDLRELYEAAVVERDQYLKENRRLRTTKGAFKVLRAALFGKGTQR